MQHSCSQVVMLLTVAGQHLPEAFFVAALWVHSVMEHVAVEDQDITPAHGNALSQQAEQSTA